MKTRISEITIAEPCLQNWDEMEKGAGFNFCKACSKNVIDFSGYTNAEIISVLAGASSSVCGRLSKTQLNQLNYHLSIVPTSNRNWMKYLGVLAIGVSVFTHNVSAMPIKKSAVIVHSKDVGKLNKVDEPTILRTFYGYMFLRNNNMPMVGLKLRLKGTDITAVTDKNGRYEFKIDDKLYWKYSELIAEDSKYVITLKLDAKTIKQKDYYPYKAEDTILGKIAVSFK
ncbi:hypothetical protein EZ456_03665 [Pedobacter psychrodurus]|uniref:Carboxypeptidase regulatory-like domain-containing protein n=1 Tax=Pedobacter psychrodurus TaxID=2530456 RepID=A0A4R0Q0S0_9SPHI|nr:hypothetical protein [Pedobacter psychrodurus]TCD29272.1 hypothetical protein EZ456_03665 [Pedobacter psychrodurus]